MAQAPWTASSSSGVGPRCPVFPKWVPCSGAEMSGTRFTRNAPAARTARTTSGRCRSFTPGMTTEFTFTRTPFSRSRAIPRSCASERIRDASRPLTFRPPRRIHG